MSTVSLVPKGRVFVRGLIAATLAKTEAHAFARNRWGDAQADRIAKTAIPALTSGDVGEPEAREFFQLAIEQSLLGRIQGLRRVPFNTRFVRQTNGATGHWVAESKPIPLSRQAVEGSTLPGLKVASIVCATKESVVAMGEVVEAGLQADLQAAISSALDLAFIDPTWAGTPNESPASATYGQTQIASSGDARQDIETLIGAYRGNLRRAVIVMAPLTAVQIGLLAAQIGETKLTVNGGVLAGIPVLCTEAVTVDSNGGSISILDAGAIAYAARDFGMEVSDQAALIMSDDPENEGEPVSLFQVNSTAWKAQAEANWEVQGSGRVVSITGVNYATGS